MEHLTKVLKSRGLLDPNFIHEGCVALEFQYDDFSITASRTEVSLRKGERWHDSHKWNTYTFLSYDKDSNAFTKVESGSLITSFEKELNNFLDSMPGMQEMTLVMHK
jgi:hypothetical protein